MKVELHLHTSRYSGCAVNSPEEMMTGLIAAGYEAVFITEHAAVWPIEELDELRGKFPQLRIFGGVELYVGSHHLLVLGTSDASYLDICDDAPAVLEKARRASHLTVLAHPFRWEEGFEMLYESLRPDAIEYCTCNHDRPAADRPQPSQPGWACRWSIPAIHTGWTSWTGSGSRHPSRWSPRPTSDGSSWPAITRTAGKNNRIAPARQQRPSRSEALPLTEYDATLGQIVGAELNDDSVAGSDADVVAAHFARDVADDLVLLFAHLDFEAEHRVGQRLLDCGFNFYCVVFGHKGLCFAYG